MPPSIPILKSDVNIPHDSAGPMHESFSNLPISLIDKCKAIDNHHLNNYNFILVDSKAKT